MKQFYIFKNYCCLILLLSGISVFSQGYTDGVFVLNEGGAGSNNASASFIKNNAVTNGIYAAANSGAGSLGDTAQSMTFNGDYAYIVLNISNQIKIVNRVTFALVATVSTGLNNPRYMAFSNGKGFVTNWGNGGSTTDDYVAVLNLETNTVESTISLAEGVERIQEINGKLYVAHTGGYGYGTTVSVINPATLTVQQTITVGDVPNSMVVNGDFLYVLCGGRPVWASPQTYGSLVKINLATNAVVNTIPFPLQHPQNLRAGDGDDVYYSIEENVYKTDITSTTLPTTPLFTTAPQGSYGIYGMDVIDNKIYLADAGNYVSPGRVYIYNSTGSLLENYTVGVIPNSFYKASPSLGIENPVALQITVAPNPTSDVFYLNTDAAAAVKLYDIQGRMVKSETYSPSGINVSGMNKGVYLVEVTLDNNRNVQRLVIR